MQNFDLHAVFKGPAGLKQRKTVAVESPMKSGSLAILFGAGSDQGRADRLDWSTAFANEALLAYFAGWARARLRWRPPRRGSRRKPSPSVLTSESRASSTSARS